MATAKFAVVFPGHSLGPFALGASLHEVITQVKEDKGQFPVINLHYSQAEPLTTPVIVSLPEDGLRLQFDGPDQRLRLIEVLDFSKTRLQLNSSDLVKMHEDSPSASGPGFKRVYSQMGPSYPGEYSPPKDRSRYGTYVLSWLGVAFNFPILHSEWSDKNDHVFLLGSHAALPATSMALFEGRNWPEVRRVLFVKRPVGPRSSVLANRPKDGLPAEIEHAHIPAEGSVELLRHGPAGIFTITLNETTIQDLITELGPPDATHKREERDATPDQNSHRRTGSTSRPMSNGRPHPGSQPSSYSSTGTDTFETDFDAGDTEEDASDRASRHRFWCYFSHGLDILVGPPEDTAAKTTEHSTRTPLGTSPHSVLLKVVIHGNVPGSYAFNRHRRLRWSISPSNDSSPSPTYLTSEHNFEHDIKPVLLSAHANSGAESEMGRGKVVNRSWGGDSSESSFYLPDAEEEENVEDAGGSSEQWLGNTKLYAFRGLTFEVLENGAVGALTVC
ncbi:hypothetical protein B0A55_11964 [Friedmanniomyces simplex]|uniref:Uncharacterized protein n=1 Tax=Friedmanniomyces simplex TaxID=329884 RepID=A0A4V6WKT3_9PEZI|nr:hypothetical protein B0A55_11964 [Friedmanniomyces simplex]